MGRPLRERPISYLPSSCPSSGARLLFERRFIRGVLSHRSLQRPSERRPDSRARSEEHTSELQSLMRISYAVFCLKKTKPLVTYHVLHYISYINYKYIQ